MITPEKLFSILYFAQTELDVERIIFEHQDIFHQDNWYPYGEDENYFGVIENQQASPIPALVEKITNSIDAVLMKKCFESKINPKGAAAPKSMEDAISKFYPNNNWDIRQSQRQQAENIQIIADGPKDDTSLIIYDNGEGQHPVDFERTFLSLLKGNKTEIHFVQGKFNMGGSGALVFCGKNRFQLIGSKRFDNSGNFGFTLLRRHKRTSQEQQTKRHTWYEYFKIDNLIPNFQIQELDLNLYNKKFQTGTIIKLYSYRMKNISDISRDLNLSLNEYLFEPALPVYTIEKVERYPKTPQMQRELYGLKRRLEKQSEVYLDSEWNFSETYQHETMGDVKVTVFVFKTRIEDKNAKDTRSAIRREFFKNNMAVMYSLNGQVQASESTVFISQSLGFQLLKDHLLIHIDCSKMNPEFRDELFMASRDRLKDGEESKELKSLLIKNLSKSKLSDLYKFRKDNLSLDGENTNILLKDIAENLSINKDLMNLIQQSFKLDIKKKETSKKETASQPNNKNKLKDETPFIPKRFPSAFSIKKHNEGIPMIKIPVNGDRSVVFNTDVDNNYFDRIEEPGELQISILNKNLNQTSGGDQLGIPKEVGPLLNIIKTSPDKGTIKLFFSPTQEVKVGDSFEIKATLTGPGKNLDQLFMVQIVDSEAPKSPNSKNNSPEEPSGLPPYVLIYRDPKVGCKTFNDLEEASISMDYPNIMHPYIENDKLDKIYINMDSTVLKSFKSKLKTDKQLMAADHRYITSVYFHTLMLYAITKQKKYSFNKIENGQEVPSDLTDYLKDIFENHYSNFLLNFGMNELIQNLE